PGANVSEPARFKLVWFVPREALDATREAVFAAGAGVIGDYARCSWYAAGTGTFRGGEGTSPAVGHAGAEERVAELRVETVVPAERLRAVVAALVAAHPYEEPAYDVYPLAEPA
ncbi:MAG: Nif3-like dinuclear metal center hexameric protein, partial [Acidobacteriota bacterium]|nr:Nif3-like dinuclear metal center hexameric protein [Acidobacteriota bacterium]